MAPSLTKANSDVLTEYADGNPPSSIALEGHKLTAHGHPFLHDIPPNIVLTPSLFVQSQKAIASDGCFIGFDSDDGPKSRHVVPLGKLLGIRFMSIFRFKVWWTTQWVGERGSDVEHETQMMILDKSESGRPYVLLLPLIEGPFRSSFQPGGNDYIDTCTESGSTHVTESRFRSSVYIHAGDDPYNLVRDAMTVVRAHLGTFKLLEEKTPPGIVDKFGWCTWDAFYLKVHPDGVWDGVKGLVEGGCPPGLVLIDDGWQSICHDEDPISDQEGMNRTAAGEQMPCRLTKFQENYKFRDYQSKKTHDGPTGGPQEGMGAFVRDLKSEFKSVDYVYVWHALCGYWGGVRPHVPGLPESRVIKPKLSPGLGTTMEDLAVDKIVNNGVGLVPPEMAHQMYDGLHSHLASVGIDGVKVDVIHLLEMLSEDFGGRVELAKAYYKAITESVQKYFKGNGVIASMEHCNDFMFLGTQAISLGRVGDDFWCTDPKGVSNGTFWLQGCHMVHCAYNSLWMGNFIHPDWDMFQSTHPCARFHAASRAISGGPIYVSDSVGKHDFELLKSLVLPDGTILRCEFYALPTRDCLFEDPLHNGKTMLKIWNLNKFTGVLGAFNCQGGGWCRKERKNRSFSEFSHAVTTKAAATNIEWGKGKNPIPIEGVESFAVYFFQAKKLVLTAPNENLEITLDPFDFELLTVSPVKILAKKMVQFAPIGLVNMLNSGGAIQLLEFVNEEDMVRVAVKGTGEMKAFSSEKPQACCLNGEDVAFIYDEKMVTIQVPWSESSKLSVIEYLF
ncbi:galactinol--sucrose galactosyltransferase [Cinnamomum micranthum f. kanehirae]|uniref:galactinol--sucrose galactosyltransferase n=1 Tax=Cinnamomum micranthum f. kanehirae TaxID=337451 RepID=A0A3S3N1J7_9MAGN|nr:galactinol--sucrose galactosyltransferase [Cinnamomum micranthum f. kanehirae]